MQTPLWVDTDIALGAARGDVDDGHALAAVLRAVQAAPQRWRLEGVSVVSGNTDAATALPCAQALLAQAGVALEVHSGAQAAQAIATLPPHSRLIALGPLSNIAAALQRDPGLAARCSLHAVTRLQQPSRHPLLRWLDLNHKRDPAAARTVLAAPWQRRVICPLDVVARLRLGAAELERLSAGSALGEYLARHSQRWARQSRWRYLSARFPAWDLVAALDAVEQLPGARYAPDDTLLGFDTDAALARYLDLIATTPAS